MGDFRVSDANTGQSTVAAAGSLLPAVVGGAANTKGSWSVLITSTDRPKYGMLFYSMEQNTASGIARGMLIDIGIAPVGAGAGTETVIVPDLLWAQQQGFQCVYLPIQIPAGYRISARLQSSTATANMYFGITTLHGGMQGMDGAQTATNYGRNLTNSSGAVLTVATVVNTVSVWTELSASVTKAARWMTVMPGGPPVTGATASFNLIDVGVGAAGAERVIVGRLPITVTALEAALCSYPTMPVNINVGDRLVARYQSSALATTGRPTLVVILWS